MRMLLSADLSAHMCFLATLFRGGCPGPRGAKRTRDGHGRGNDKVGASVAVPLHEEGGGDDNTTTNNNENDGGVGHDLHSQVEDHLEDHDSVRSPRIFLGLCRPPSTLRVIHGRLNNLETQWTELREDIVALPAIKRKLFQIQTAVLEAEEGGHPMRCKRLQHVAEQVRGRMEEIMDRMQTLSNDLKVFCTEVQGIAARATFSHQTYRQICADLSTRIQNEHVSRLVRLDTSLLQMRTTGVTDDNPSQDVLWARRAYYYGKQEIADMFQLADIPRWRLATLLHTHRRRLEDLQPLQKRSGGEGSRARSPLPPSLSPQQQRQQQEEQQEGEEQGGRPPRYFSQGPRQAFLHSTVEDVKSWLRLHAADLHAIFRHYGSLSNYNKRPHMAAVIRGRNEDHDRTQENSTTVMSLAEFWCFVLDFEFLRAGCEGGMPVTASFIEQLFVDVKEGSGDGGEMVSPGETRDEVVNHYLYGRNSRYCTTESKNKTKTTKKHDLEDRKVGLLSSQFTECLLCILSQRYQHLPLYVGLRNILFPSGGRLLLSSSRPSEETLRARLTSAPVHRVYSRHHHWLFRVFRRFASKTVDSFGIAEPEREDDEKRSSMISVFRVAMKDRVVTGREEEGCKRGGRYSPSSSLGGRLSRSSGGASISKSTCGDSLSHDHHRFSQLCPKLRTPSEPCEHETHAVT